MRGPSGLIQRVATELENGTETFDVGFFVPPKDSAKAVKQHPSPDPVSYFRVTNNNRPMASTSAKFYTILKDTYDCPMHW